MENKLVFNGKDNSFENFDNDTNTLTINGIKGDIYHIVFDNYVPNDFVIDIKNSDITIIEEYKGIIKNAKFNINIDENSKLIRFSILVFNKSRFVVRTNINNKGYYQSMQMDLTNNSIDSVENINLEKEKAYALVIDGIYAIDKAQKTYQTNINHYAPFSTSKAQIFAVNNDFAKVSIYTDAYIKNKAIGTKTQQEGRIINLSDNCTGIVLPNLHIDENDVEASHSCSVGSVNKDHLYYLQTRGLTSLQARNILIKGYFNPLLENVKDEKIKEKLNKILDKRIG